MKYYIIQCYTGLQGSSRYSTREEAQHAAEWRTYCTGLAWFVREMNTRR